MLPSRCFTALLFCAANHKPTKIPTPLLRTYCAVAATRHIQMPASIGKQPILLWSYHAFSKNRAHYLNVHVHSKSNFRRDRRYLTPLGRCICTASAESNEEEKYKKPLLYSTIKEELFQAIENNNIENIKEILATYKYPLNVRDEDGMTPFLHAAEKGHLDILKALEAKGADVYATDEDGNNALHFACKMGRIETVRCLLNNCNINLETRGFWGTTAFLFAVEKSDLDILKLLKAYGPDVSAIDDSGNNALHYACKMGKTKIVNWLLSNFKINLDLEARGSLGRTPFLDATQNGNLDILKLFKENGADVYAIDKYGSNALHYACRAGELEAVKWLLNDCDMNFDLETRGFLGKTPFLCAATRGSFEVVKLLHKSGANIYAIADDGENALQLAQYSHNQVVIRYLQSLGLS